MSSLLGRAIFNRRSPPPPLCVTLPWTWGASCPFPTPARPWTCWGSLQQVPLWYHKAHKDLVDFALGSHWYERFVNRVNRKLSPPKSTLLILKFESVHARWEKTCQIMWQRNGKRNKGLQWKLLCKAVLISLPLLLLEIPVPHTADAEPLSTSASQSLHDEAKTDFSPARTSGASPPPADALTFQPVFEQCNRAQGAGLRGLWGHACDRKMGKEPTASRHGL